jgi:hypothetical protein
MSEEDRYKSAYAKILNERGYLVFGSSIKQKPGQLHSGGRWPASISQPFTVIAETNRADMLQQSPFLEAEGFSVGNGEFEYYYRVVTD